MLNKVIKNKTGFTILEITVTMAIFLLSIILIGSLYIIAQRLYNQSSNRAELAQNGRVILDRISRELRQAANIVTPLPPTNTDPGNPPAEEIFFQDGHDISQITYIRYYLDGTDLRRQHKSYYFANEPDTYVYWNSADPNGNPPLANVLSEAIVGEYFSGLAFWGSGGEINIEVNLNKKQSAMEIKTSVYKRN